MKRAIAYIRISTLGQDDKFGKEAQLELINSYAKENNYEIVEVLYDCVSGVKETRESFDKIIYGEYSDIDVITAKTDRIARDMQLYYYYSMLLSKKNINLVSIQDDFAQFGEFANILKAFTLFVAEQERSNITKRTTGGRKVKAAKGGYSGGKVPYGYKVNNGKLEIVEEEKEFLLKLFAMKRNKMSVKSILSILDPNNNWSTSTIYYILKNEEFYKGNYSYGGIKTIGDYEPIL